MGILGTNCREIVSEIHRFSFQKNAFENVVYEIAEILSRPQCVNSSKLSAEYMLQQNVYQQSGVI